MTYNEGVHGAEDIAKRWSGPGGAFDVVSDDWQGRSFGGRVGRWARAVAAMTAWRRLKVSILGYAMNDMGDIRVDDSALVRCLGPEITVIAPGDLYGGMVAVTPDEVRRGDRLRGRALRDRSAAVGDQREGPRPHAGGARAASSTGGGAGAARTLRRDRRDGRFRRLPFAAASSADGAGPPTRPRATC